jgi:hypothetical protein
MTQEIQAKTKAHLHPKKAEKTMLMGNPKETGFSLYQMNIQRAGLNIEPTPL